MNEGSAQKAPKAQQSFGSKRVCSLKIFLQYFCDF
jgi:hypothetical protein